MFRFTNYLVLALVLLSFESASGKTNSPARKIAQVEGSCYSFKAMEGQSVVLYTSTNGPYFQIYFGEFFDSLNCKKTKVKDVYECTHRALDKNRKSILDGKITLNLGASPVISTKSLNNISHKFAEFDIDARKYLAKINDLDKEPLEKMESCPPSPNAEQ
ncbi:MAG: hypothetical protein K2Q18_07650 [Bdellovibrionales bacterium]|nr:hypothetical protein [Bdellovibrionales bacterium]